MKLHKYAEDRLVKLLNDLSEKATPGPWKSPPKPVRVEHLGIKGPLMSYLVGNPTTGAGLTVSLGSERLADHEFVVELVNAWRAGRLYVITEA